MSVINAVDLDAATAITCHMAKLEGSMSKIRQSARGKECQLRLPAVCSHNNETVVCCHIRIAGTCGVGMKPSDLLSLRACSRCHAVMDGHVKRPDHISSDDLTIYVHEAHCRTLVQYEKEGLVKI